MLSLGTVVRWLNKAMLHYCINKVDEQADCLELS